jgi:hypothetical protein
MPAFMALTVRGGDGGCGKGWTHYDHQEIRRNHGLGASRTENGEQALRIQISSEVRPVVGCGSIKKNTSMFLNEWEPSPSRSCCPGRATL